MAVREWYAGRELFLTGVTSELGRSLLEKILRSLPDTRVYVLVRSRHNLTKDDRVTSILQSPRFERLRQEDPNAASRVKAIEGNLIYEDLGISGQDKGMLRNVTVLFHAAGSYESVVEFCQELPRLEVFAAASSLTRHKKTETPTALLRVSFLGPAYRDPMPGMVELLKGPTAFMAGAGLALGDSTLEAEIVPVDTAVNTLIVAAWDRASDKKDIGGTVVYDPMTIGCTWDELIKKGQRANSKFAYPTFGVRGMTSIRPVYQLSVLLLEWLPSALCDTILSVCGEKRRILEEHYRVRNALRSLESISSRPRSAERGRIRLLEKRLASEDQAAFPLAPEIDIESYVVCAAAAARKYCVDQANLTVLTIFRVLFLLALLLGLLLLFLRYPLFGTRAAEPSEI